MQARSITVGRARDLRASMTVPELMLWRQLRGKRLEGLRFRRQHPIGPYILDFICPDRNLAIEVDGEGHGVDAQQGYDRARDEWLAKRGVRVLRLPAIYVIQELGDAMATIAAEATERKPDNRVQPRIA
jgi:very-short-patch-repair endonuclease